MATSHDTLNHTLKVGALATRTGVSVRTLHHYDDIGLLSPSLRTPSGHRLYVVNEIARLQQIQSLRLMGLSLEEIGGLLDSHNFSAQRVIEATTVMDKYFTPEQLTAMHARGEALGVDKITEVERAWAEVIPAVRAHMAKNTPPTDPALQALAERWRELVNAFTGGDRAVPQNVRTMYQAEHTTINAEHHNTPNPEMFTYMGKVFALIGGGPG